MIFQIDTFVLQVTFIVIPTSLKHHHHNLNESRSRQSLKKIKKKTKQYPHYEKVIIQKSSTTRD